MVSLAIMGILAAAVLINTAKNTDRDVRQEKDRLVSFLRNVQNKALTGEREGITLTHKLCGFGAHRDSNSKVRVYFIETEDVGLVSWKDVKCEDVDNRYKATTAFEEFNFKNNVRVNAFSDIFFMIPDGDIYYNNSGPISSDITINFSGSTVTVTIDKSGKIY